MKYLFLVLIILVLTNSCTKEYSFKQDYSPEKLVVNGALTNQNGPNYIILTKSLDKLPTESYDNRTYTPYLNGYTTADYINDAEVYITDETDFQIDTLAKKWTLYRHKQNASDSVGDYGVYQTTKLKGIPEHSYLLTIKWQNQEYHAKSYMPPVPPIDSAKFKFTKGAVGKSDYDIPLIYFKEPENERNYYLFITPGNDRVWPFSILSDEYLDEYVNGLDVCKGVSPDYWMTAYPYVYDGKLMNDYFIEMHSLTKEAYEYYKALIQQFRTDGGAYSPSPASPPTNLDNGALGFFRASAVDRVDFSRDDVSY